jgi:two-component system NtrC family sensor kinase
MNTRVLIIDDEEFVRDNIDEVLSPRKKPNPELAQAVSFLFSDEEDQWALPAAPRLMDFLIDKASSGEEGVEKVLASLRLANPYAVIFLDMRMPGWDGLETAIQIRQHDARVEIIFLTAYSDRSIEEIVDQAGQNVSYHCKPYANEEIIQLATKAVTDYNRLRELEKLLSVIATITTPEHNLTVLLQNVLNQLAAYLNTDVALLGKLYPDGRYEKLLSVGSVENAMNLTGLIDRIQSVESDQNEIVQLGEFVFSRMDSYCIFAFLGNQQKLKIEKRYLLKLFVQNATIAIRNAELYERLLQKEKLSAIGQALSMVMHDLRTPIGNLKMLTAMVRENGIDPEDLDIYDQIGDQAMAIVNDFIDFIRETSVTKNPVPLQSLLDDCIVETSKIDPTIRFSTQISAGLTAMGDASKLRRVFQNLLNNAAEAIKYQKSPAKEISVRAHAVNDRVMLQIRDNGAGIPLDIADTLFEPFVTQHKANGTGLGLAIVKQFVQAHGGTITVCNDGGAVFDISLPAR